MGAINFNNVIPVHEQSLRRVNNKMDQMTAKKIYNIKIYYPINWIGVMQTVT